MPSPLSSPEMAVAVRQTAARLRENISLTVALVRPVVAIFQEVPLLRGLAILHGQCPLRRTFARPQLRSSVGLAQHYAKVFCPEESLFQCLLCNAPQLRVVNDHYRYIDWRGGGNHPKTLKCDDLPELTASPAHFARKFDIRQDVAVLDRLDAYWFVRIRLLRRLRCLTGGGANVPQPFCGQCPGSVDVRASTIVSSLALIVSADVRNVTFGFQSITLISNCPLTKQPVYETEFAARELKRLMTRAGGPA